MEVAKQSIEGVKKFLYEDLGLQSTLTEVELEQSILILWQKKLVKGKYCRHSNQAWKRRYQINF